MIETVPSGTILHGRYRIERVLGSGGFGHVYLAIDLTTNQQYAVKEYLVSGASGQEQLKHEATVLSQLHHPSLPAFQDAFIERGRYYVVLDYIEGNDLTDLIRMVRQRNESIPVVQILTWILSICNAVTFLHHQQPIVIHRDIKPDNIRITPAGTAVLVDLGNAKAAADGARTLFFIRHQGTPGYAPPEQYPGGSGTDARSDVYALGGTLYFALTTQEPPSVSVRNQSVQQGQADLPSLRDHLLNNPAEESAEANAAKQFRLGVNKPAKPAPRHVRHIAQLGMLPPALLQQLSNIIQKAMALKPKNRYQQITELANDLKQVIAALPAPPPPSPPKTPRRLDPNSTQPDLAELYEALQDAKEREKKDIPDIGTQPMEDNDNIACPRCGLPLAQKAIFCPRCGTSLLNPRYVHPSDASADVNGSNGTRHKSQPAVARLKRPGTAVYDRQRNQSVARNTSVDINQPRPQQTVARHQTDQVLPTRAEMQQFASAHGDAPQMVTQTQGAQNGLLSNGQLTWKGMLLLVIVVLVVLTLLILFLHHL